ncbi:hypothetical protein GEMRC1_009032 [Eukaryota sp. GEM-RC1]
MEASITLYNKEKVKHEGIISDLETRLSDLNQEKERVESQSGSKIEELNDQISDLNSQIDTLLSSTNSEKRSINQTSLSLRNRIDSLNGQVSKLQSELKNQQNHHVQEIKNLKNSLSEKDEEIRVLHRKIEENETSLRRCNNQLNSMEKERDSLRTSLDLEVSSLKAKLASSQSEIETLIASKKDLELELGALQSHNSRLIADVDDLSSTHKSGISQEILQSQLDSLQSQLKKNQELLDIVQTQRRQLQEDNSILSQQLSSIEAKHSVATEQLREELDEAREELTRNSLTTARLQESKGVLEKEVEELNSALTQHLETIKKLNSVIESKDLELSRVISDKNTFEADQSRSLIDLQRKIEESDREINILKDEKSSLALKVDEQNALVADFELKKS